MDEYIKREDALDAVLFALAGTGHQSTAIYAIREVPTADAAPKSEVARDIFAEIKEERRRWESVYCSDYFGEGGSAYGYLEFEVDDTLARLERKYTEKINNENH